MQEVIYKNAHHISPNELEEMTRVWAGEAGVGPPPANGRRRPGLLIGGTSQAAYRRAAEYADGWTQGGAGPAAFAESLGQLHDAWEAAGRSDRPRTIALFY